MGIGYAIGTLIGHIGHRILQRLDLEPPARAKRICWIVVSVAAVGVVLLSTFVWPIWQNDQRDLVSMEHVTRLVTLPMLIVTAILLLVLVLFGRLIARGVIRLHRFNSAPPAAGRSPSRSR